MTLKKIISISLLLLLPILASAAISAQQVIDKAAKKIESTPSLTAKFTGSLSGTLVASGNKFSIVADGFGVWYNGNDMWTYSKQSGETSLTIPTQSELLESNPLEIIKVHGKKFTPTKISEKAGKYALKLTPKSKVDNVKEATLVINTTSWLPESINILFANGSNFIINIVSISESKTVSAEAFVYPEKSYRGVEVVDLR